MFYSEKKLQTWRALAVLDSGSECLVCLGRSATQIRDVYTEALTELLSGDEPESVRKLSLERWQGTPDQGRWVPMGSLALPSPARQRAARFATV